MLDNFAHWFRYSSLFEKGIVFVVIFLFVLIFVAAVDPGDAQANRKTFCLDRGYDRYETSQKNFYCKNTVNGNIKKFPNPLKKKLKVKKDKDTWE